MTSFILMGIQKSYDKNQTKQTNLAFKINYITKLNKIFRSYLNLKQVKLY